MSLGHGGFARIVAQDELTVIYEYGAYNLNDEKFRNRDHNFDGTIMIDKTSLSYFPLIDKKMFVCYHKFEVMNND